MELLTKQGESKLVAECSYPVTGVNCVNRVYTDHGVFDVTPSGFVVREIIKGLSFDELQKLAQVPLTFEPLEAATTLEA
jgi:3-oxoadipate CoA-transferase beta subunit